MSISKSFNKASGVTYVYEVYDNHWDPKLKKSVSRRKLIGKIDPATGEIVPTGPRGRPPKNPLPAQPPDKDGLSDTLAETQGLNYKVLYESALKTISSHEQKAALYEKKISDLEEQINRLCQFDLSLVDIIKNELSSVEQFEEKKT